MFGLDYTWLFQPTYQSWLLEGLTNTLLLAVLSSVCALAIGVIGASIICRQVPVASAIVRWVVELFRNTPPLLQMLFLYFALTQLGFTVRDPATGHQVPLLNSFACATFSLSLFGGASCIEVMRAGIDAVPRTTVEAARSLGYSGAGTLFRIQLPIAARISMPALINVLVNLIKTTAEASVIAVPELMYYAGQIFNDNFLTLEVMSLILVTYVAIVSIVTFGLRRVERALAYPGYG
jgi:polar amino acid transport system permease protein